MFDLGFSELFLIAIVALVVLGPERLPKAARFAGLWIRRARSQWNSVKSEFENELADEDLAASLRATRDEMSDMRRQFEEGGENLRRDFEPDRDQIEQKQAELEQDHELASASDPALDPDFDPEYEPAPKAPEPDESQPDEPERREPQPGNRSGASPAPPSRSAATLRPASPAIRHRTSNSTDR